MSYNGSGTFQINTSGQPVVTGTSISSTVFNALTADLATGLSTAITKDGQTTTTARIPFALGINSTLVTDATNTTSGSIITAGGVGIAKALYVGTTANVAGLTASSAVATDASKNLVSVTNTGTGNNVLATAPTIASLNLTTALTIASASGTVGQALTSGGSGNAPTWSTIAATPGGSTTQVQYNNAGAFAGSANLTYASGTLSVLATTSSAFSGAADAGYSLFRGTTNSSGGVLSVSGNSTGNGINYVVFNSTLTGYEPSNYGASQHIWKLGATEALRLNSSANLVLQGGTTTANGIGITFPATQSASTDANTLDDYEEGTWTPALSTTTGSISFSSVSGTYTKIGRLVYVRGSFGGTATISSPTGDLKLTSLPFTVGSPELAAGSTTPYNFTAGAYSINLETLGGTTTAYIFNFANGTRSSAHSYIQNGCALNLSMCYQI